MIHSTYISTDITINNPHLAMNLSWEYSLDSQKSFTMNCLKPTDEYSLQASISQTIAAQPFFSTTSHQLKEQMLKNSSELQVMYRRTIIEFFQSSGIDAIFTYTDCIATP